ncbi:hypothetical protein M1N61_03200 [Peptococcaceae bacterium]|nr:hypothetical protein [Peptococcaceae bacterium]
MFDNGKEYNSACGCTCQTSDYRMFDNAKEYNRPILHTLAFFGILFAILIFGTMGIDLINKIVVIGVLIILLLFSIV